MTFLVITLQHFSTFFKFIVDGPLYVVLSPSVYALPLNLHKVFHYHI